MFRQVQRERKCFTAFRLQDYAMQKQKRKRRNWLHQDKWEFPKLHLSAFSFSYPACFKVSLDTVNTSKFHFCLLSDRHECHGVHAHEWWVMYKRNWAIDGAACQKQQRYSFSSAILATSAETRTIECLHVLYICDCSPFHTACSRWECFPFCILNTQYL